MTIACQRNMTDFENSETSDLDKLLKELYFNIRRINGEYYNRSS